MPCSAPNTLSILCGLHVSAKKKKTANLQAGISPFLKWYSRRAHQGTDSPTSSQLSHRGRGGSGGRGAPCEPQTLQRQVRTLMPALGAASPAAATALALETLERSLSTANRCALSIDGRSASQQDASEWEAGSLRAPGGVGAALPVLYRTGAFE